MVGLGLIGKLSKEHTVSSEIQMKHFIKTNAPIISPIIIIGEITKSKLPNRYVNNKESDILAYPYLVQVLVSQSLEFICDFVICILRKFILRSASGLSVTTAYGNPCLIINWIVGL